MPDPSEPTSSSAGQLNLPRWGVLLLNLGTPDSPHAKDVRPYLREFLTDPRVLDINPVLRTALVYGAILPTRPKESGEAYEKIWTERGSPLRFHTADLVEQVATRLAAETGAAVPVEFAMRYGKPGIGPTLQAMQAAGIDRILVIPLFPQYSSAANGSAIQKVFEEAGKLWNVPSLHFVEEFYAHPAFVDAFVQIGKRTLEEFQPDHVLMSYHGLPERHMRKSDTTGGAWCLQDAGCCDRLNASNRFCYRAQCYATSRGLASGLGLAPDGYSVAFQSRLGRDPWIRPYTDERVVELAKSGVRRLAVMCPAFVADCLETIEEIGMRAKEDFVEAGGEDLVLVPSLNAEPVWADAVTTLLLEHLPPAWTRPLRQDPAWA